jgi:hypothetical protein
MPSSADLRSGFQRAADFVLRSRGASGFWEEFTSTAGPSTEWVTGFVLASLARHEHPEIGEARARLLDCQRADGSWGFCSRVPGDADSTAWAVLGLGSALPDDRRTAAATFLQAQQLGGGGFRTYPDTAATGLRPWAPRADDHRGWQAPHTCVSGTVLLALAELGQGGWRADAAARYLADRQAPSGVWPSYWWSGVAYSTHQALRALRGHGLLTTSVASRAARELFRRQLPSGGWAWDGSLAGQAGAFETALALLALNEAREAGAEPDTDCIRRGLDWLRQGQSKAGRWRSGAILRVPMPGDTRECLGACEAPARPGGLGTDASGVFTAAIAARCLATYQDWSPESARRRPAVPARRPQADVVPAVLEFLVLHEAQTAFARTMSSRGLTISPATQATVVDTDRRHGHRIAARLPSPASDSRFFGRYWRDQTVPVLGFGWGMTHVLAAHQPLPCQPEAAELGAVLILGTAAVDQLFDASPRRRDALLTVLSRDLLIAAADRSTGQRALTEASRAAPDADIRYVLGLVSAFFLRLTRCDLDEVWYQRICDLLLQAYDAELRTLASRPPGRLSAEILQAHLSARVLPFRVISAIQCGLCRHACGGSDQGSCARAAQLLGEAVAAVDDLADLCADARRGAANSLLTLSGDPDRAAGLQAPSRALVGVLSSGACWRAATSVARALIQLADSLPPHHESPQPCSRDQALAHLWGWGDLGRPVLGGWQPQQHRATAPASPQAF